MNDIGFTTMYIFCLNAIFTTEKMIQALNPRVVSANIIYNILHEDWGHKLKNSEYL